MYIDKSAHFIFYNVEEEKQQQQDAPAPGRRVVETTNIIAKCKDYHNKADELFDDASKEVEWQQNVIMVGQAWQGFYPSLVPVVVAL